VTRRLTAILLLLLLAGTAVAQTRRAPAAAAADDNVRLRELGWQGGSSKIETPQYDTTASRGVTKRGEWWQFIVQYDTKEEWTDELTFDFHVLGLGAVEGKKAYSYYTIRVSYIDIAKGRGHLATVFLRPNTIERYGMPVAFAVEIHHKGEMIAQESEAATKLSKVWWKDPNVVDSALVTKRPKYLLNRAQTPFAFVDVDLYETIKP
jgi:hypothetical protein